MSFDSGGKLTGTYDTQKQADPSGAESFTNTVHAVRAR
jgi:hypothetical protein